MVDGNKIIIYNSQTGSCELTYNTYNYDYDRFNSDVEDTENVLLEILNRKDPKIILKLLLLVIGNTQYECGYLPRVSSNYDFYISWRYGNSINFKGYVLCLPLKIININPQSLTFDDIEIGNQKIDPKEFNDSCCGLVYYDIVHIHTKINSHRLLRYLQTLSKEELIAFDRDITKIIKNPDKYDDYIYKMTNMIGLELTSKKILSDAELQLELAGAVITFNSRRHN